MNPNSYANELLLKVTKMMKNQFGLKLKGLTFSYKCQYLEWYNLVALPANYRLPEFAKFTGQDNTSTIEHVSLYLTQLGEASVEDAHQVRFFSLSLSGSAFTWFSSLPVNFVANWADLEKKFHTYFYTRTGEKKCRCFVQAPASKFIVMHVRLGWCAKGHKIYTGSGQKSLRPVCCGSCY